MNFNSKIMTLNNIESVPYLTYNSLLEVIQDEEFVTKIQDE